MIHLFELVGRDDRLAFSPAVWRTRMQLLHKGITFSTTPWRFTETDKLAETGSRTVPVIHHDGQWINDSFKIALYLEDKFPEKPLFGSDAAREMASFFHHWQVRTALSSLFPMLAVSVWHMISPHDQAYFRKDREKILGTSLEEAAIHARGNLNGFHKSLSPATAMLRKAPFLHGDVPGFMDYDLFGPFMWARTISSFDVLAGDETLNAWMERMLDLFDGHARAAATIISLGFADEDFQP